MRTRSMVAIFLVLGMTAIGSASEASRKPKRVERTTEKSYIPPVGVGNFSVGIFVNGAQIGGASFITGTNDHYVQIEIEDDSGQPTYATVYQGDTDEDFCDVTEEPLPIKAGKRVYVQLYQGPCLDSMTPALATTGIVRATFSNLP